MKEKKQNIHTGLLIKKDGKLVFKNKSQQVMFTQFVASLVESQECEIFYNALSELGSPASLARTNIMARELGNEIGISPDEVKDQAKRHCGFVVGNEVKSCGDMSNAELATVRQELVRMGEFVGFTFPRER